jgi:hypothetical protein
MCVACFDECKPYLDGYIVLINLKVCSPKHPKVLSWYQALLLHWHIAGAGGCCCIALLLCLLLIPSVSTHVGVCYVSGVAHELQQGLYGAVSWQYCATRATVEYVVLKHKSTRDVQ